MQEKGGLQMATLLEQRYRVDAPLARGGMSAVYRGMDTRLERPVAIKVMDQRFAEDRSFVDRFEREARAAASLHHPNVIAVHDQGFDGDHVFLVMELVDGGTLRDLLTERGRLTVPLALSVLEPVLSALAAAHRAGLVHRDVKPENVLIGKQGTVKVGDFGLVKAMASAGNTSNSVILGTVAYLSPEQVTTGATTSAGDVYSAGVLLYEMLTGTPPYVGDTPISVAYRHVNDNVQPPSRTVPEIPQALDDLVLRATCRDPAGRPIDAAAFLLELQRVRVAIGAPVVPIPSPAHGQQTMPRQIDMPTVQTFTGQPVNPSVPGPQGTKAMLRSELDGVARPLIERDPPRSVPITGPQPVAKKPPTRSRPPKRQDREKPAPRRKIPLWAIIAGVVALVAGLGTYFLTRVDPVAIPNVVNKDRATAVRLIEEAKLVPNVLTARSNTISKNQVIRTDPASGTLNPGSGVNVYVSAGPPVVPEVQPGAAVATVEKALKDQDLKPTPAGDDENQFDNTVPKGAVLSVSPSPGTQLKIGDSVTMILSKGPAPLKPLPNVVGQSTQDATRLVQEAGYTVANVREQFNPNVDGGKVISTDPQAGAIAQDKKVTLLVSNAVTVPDLRGKRLNEARDTLSKLGLNLDVVGFGNRDRGKIFVQGPNAGTRVQKGSTVQVALDFFGGG